MVFSLFIAGDELSTLDAYLEGLFVLPRNINVPRGGYHLPPGNTVRTTGDSLSYPGK